MLRLRSASLRAAAGAAGVRSNTTIAGTVYYRCNYHDKTATALVCPKENVKWTYEQLWQKISGLAGGLKESGYGQGDVVATDNTNSTATLLLQLAASHNGMQVLTVKTMAELDEFAPALNVAGVVMSSASSFLSKSPMKKGVVAELSGAPSDGMTDRYLDLAYYGGLKVTGNREVYLHGVGMAGLLEVKTADQVCVSASICHSFGMGAATMAFVRNATVHLPDMANPDLADSTLLITDTHQLAKWRETAKNKAGLRGGIVKVGSGTDVLKATEEVGGVQLRTLGKGSEAEVMRPLFDSMKDTYYSFK